MSTIDATTGDDQRPSREREADAPAARAQLPRFTTPIVPRSTIAGRALVAVVAIMTFLASLTTGAVVLVYGAASEWRAEVSREVTIQIRPTAGRDIEADIAKAVMIARAFPGIAEVRPYSKEETARLLEPWLGAGLQLDDLPVPRLIVVRVASGATPDFAQLRGALAEQVPAASLDDHRGFVARMRAMASAAIVAGLAVLALVVVATILSVMFATRAAMATNRPVIEVLHFIGAKNSFIAEHIQRHFLQLGLRGGALGGGSALVLFGLAEFANGRFLDFASGNQFGALFGTFSIGILGYVAVVAQIGLIALVTAATSRRTVGRTIQTIH
jgi:cell division transport system permease protein